jgi:N-acetyl-beta-hexosaminidase
MGRVLNAFAKFNEQHGDIDFERALSPKTYKDLQEFADDYRLKLNAALDEVSRRKDAAYAGLRQKEWGEVEWYELLCPECGHETLVPDAEAQNGHICTYCGNTESEDIPEECTVCGERWPLVDMVVNSGPDRHGEYFRVCPNCQARWDKQ